MRTGTVPLPVAWKVQLSADVMGTGGISCYVAKFSQVGSKCLDAPESSRHVVLLTSLLAFTDEKSIATAKA
jgi:hypothetical protein